MDWAEARRLALAYAKHTLGDDPPLAASPEGWEDATHYQVTVDAQAALDGDHTASLVDTPLLLVDKATGKVTTPPWLDLIQRRDHMTPVGDSTP